MQPAVVSAQSVVRASTRPALGLPSLVAAAATCFAFLDRGAFYRPAALIVLVALTAAAVAGVRLRPLDRQERRLALAVVGLAAWWVFAALGWGEPGAALPFAASVVGFVAAFVCGGRLGAVARSQLPGAVVALGVGLAVAGLVGVAWRVYPLAMPAQDLWRLASSLTYANAAGLVLAMCLLVACGAEVGTPQVQRIAVCLLAAGLVASMSRGGLLAFGVGALVLPATCWRPAALPLVAGALAGTVAAAAAHGRGVQPVVALAVLVAVGVCAMPAGRRRVAIGVGLLLAGVLGVATTDLGGHLRDALATRAGSASADDRSAEWQAAATQWWSRPVVGVGPERPLFLTSGDGARLAHYAHNEYLQVAADTGLVGLGLLIGVGGLLAVTLRRRDAPAAAGVAALCAFAVGGALDFSWHLPAVSVLAGWAASLAHSKGSP